MGLVAADSAADSRGADSRLRRLIGWASGESPGPWDLVRYPTNRCNLRCAICWQNLSTRALRKVDTHQEVSDARLRRLADEAADLGVREWILCGGGDPLMRVALVMDLCERIVGRGMNGEVHCNGISSTSSAWDGANAGSASTGRIRQ